MPRQHNETNSEYKRRVIDIKSESFCAAKWYNATIWLGSGMTTSCHHPLPHKIDIDDVQRNPSALHNTQKKKMEREQMQKGERPSGCEYCWKIEDMGKDAISDRVFKTVIYSDEDLNYAYRTPASQDFNLQTLEISFDRTCQFACSYCNPAFSSTWVRDIRTNGPYQGLASDGRGHFTHAHDNSQLYKFGEDNPYINAFFKWWESDLHRSLKELRVTGGEPLMSGYTWQLLDWFKDNKGKSSTRLALNSNLGAAVDLDRLLSSVDGVEFDLYTSNEAFGSRSEYIRDGLEWKSWAANVEKAATSGKLRGLHMMCTVNALCLDGLTVFLDQLMLWKEMWGRDFPTFTLNILRFPSFQSPLVLPSDLRSSFAQELEAWLHNNRGRGLMHQMEIDHLKRLIEYLQTVDSPHEGAAKQDILQQDFKKFYEQYDQRRGKNFVDTFPGLANWYQSL